MQFSRRALAAIVVAAVAALAPDARADLYGKTTFASGFSVSMQGNIAINTQAGTFTTYLADDSKGTGATPYISYCVDLKHFTDPNNYNVLDYTPTQLPLTGEFTIGASNLHEDTPWFRAGMGRAAWLVNTFGDDVTTNVARGLLQVAIWKVLYSGPDDTDAQYKDITQGSEYATWLTASQKAVINGYLTASFNAGGGTYAMSKALWVNFKDVTGNHVQFQVIGVPEPSSLAIAVLGGLGLIGLGIRRRPGLA